MRQTGPLRLPPSQNRHGEIIKHRVTDLVQEHFECRPHYSVRSGDASGRRFLGSILQDVFKVLVANSDGVICIPGVGFSITSLNFQQERARQTQCAQKTFEFFENPSLF